MERLELNLVIIRNNRNNKLKYNKERHWIECKRNQEATSNSQDIF